MGTGQNGVLCYRNKGNHQDKNQTDCYYYIECRKGTSRRIPAKVHFPLYRIPDKKKMEEIVNVHFDSINENLLAQAMEAFYKIRDMRDIQKKPSTSELLDWLQALILSGIAVERITEEIPYAGVLLKKNQDIDAMFEIKEKGYSLKRW